MKVHCFICAALLCSAQWGHRASLSKLDMQNAAALGNLTQKESTGNQYMQAVAASGNNENKTRLDTSITGSFQGFNSLSKIGEVFVQPTEKRSSKSSPEPGTVFLLGAGMAGVILITRRRRKR